MRLWFGITLLLLGFAGRAGAAEEALSLRGAVAATLAHNPSLRASGADVEAARTAAQGARALANPEIVMAPSAAGEAGSDEEFLLVQPLEINGRRRARTRVAKAELEAAISGHTATQRDTIRAVKGAYWEAAEAQAVVDLNRENVQLAELLSQAAQRQVEVGTAPGSQAIKARVEVSRARQELARAETTLAQAKAALNTLMGRSPATPFLLADGLTYTPLTLNPASLPALAQASRPEIAEAQAQLAARRGQISVAQARRRPDLALQARQETLGGPGGWAVSISLPLFDWGSLRGERKQAEAAAAAQEQRLVATRNAVDSDVYAALREVERSETLVQEYQRGTLAEAEQLAEMARKGYQAGATGYLEVLEAQRTLRSVRTDYYAALAEHLRAVAQLEWAVGVDLESLVTKETLP